MEVLSLRGADLPMTSTPEPSVRRAGAQLLAVSFVVLFQELALIRWLPVQVRVVAYFPNLILIGAFLGLGLGLYGPVTGP